MPLETSQILKSSIALFLFSIVLPTLDVYSDISLSVRVFQHGHIHYALILATPLLINFTLTMVAWWRIDTGNNRWWSWMVVVAQVWPQTQAAGVMVDIIKGKEEALLRKKVLDRELSGLEPFLESVPQVLIMTYFYFNLLVDKEGGLFWKKVIEDKTEERKIVLGEDINMFFISYVLSVLSGGLGLAKYLKTGPCHILPDEGSMGGMFTLRFLLVFLAVSFSFVSKAIVLAGLIMHTYLMDTPFLTKLSMTLGTTTKEPSLGLSLTTTLLPQLLLSLFSIFLCLGSGRKLWKTLITYPALLLLPVFCHFTFGARNSRCSSGCCGDCSCGGCCCGASRFGGCLCEESRCGQNKCGAGCKSEDDEGQLVMSWTWTLLNILISILGVTVTFIDVILDIGTRRFWRSDTVLTSVPLIVCFSLGYILTLMLMLLSRCGLVKLEFGVLVAGDMDRQYVVCREGSKEWLVRPGVEGKDGIDMEESVGMMNMEGLVRRQHEEGIKLSEEGGL